MEKALKRDTPFNSTTSKAALAFSFVEGAKRVYDEGREYWRTHFSYTVTVSEKDVLYDEVHNWLIEVTPDEKHRSLSVGSGHNSRSNDVVSHDDISVELSKPLIIRLDEGSSRKIIIEKHQVTVTLVIPEDGGSEYRQKPLAKIEFIVNSYAGQQAVIRQLELLNNSRRTTRKQC